jgi:hypothetical protein
MLNATQIADKWERNTQGATESFKAGVNAVTESPMAQAARASDQYLRGVTEAVTSGKWQAGLNRVSLSDWKAATAGKGATRIAEGVRTSKPKMQQFLQDFLPHVANVAANLPPRGGLEDNIARMVQQVRGNSQFVRRN